MVGGGEHRDWSVRDAGDDAWELLWISVQGLRPSSQDLSETMRSEVDKQTQIQALKSILSSLRGEVVIGYCLLKGL